MRPQRHASDDQLDAVTWCRHLVTDGSVYAFLADHRHQLFPAELVADVSRHGGGHPSVPAEVIATVMVLRALEGLGDREAISALRRDIAWKVACGLRLDDEGFHPTVPVYWRNRVRRGPAGPPCPQDQRAAAGRLQGPHRRRARDRAGDGVCPDRRQPRDGPYQSRTADLPTSPTPSPDGGEDQTVTLHARTRMALAWSRWLVTVRCCAVLLAVIRSLMLAVVADAVSWMVFLLGDATIGLVVTLRRPTNPTGCRAVPTTVVG